MYGARADRSIRRHFSVTTATAIIYSNSSCHMNAKEWIEYLSHAGELSPFQGTSPNRTVAPRIDRKGVESAKTSSSLTGPVQIPAIPARDPYNCFGLEKYFCSGYQDNEQEVILHVMDYNRLLAGIAGNSMAKVPTGMASASFRCPQLSRSGPIFLWVSGNGASGIESN